MDQSSQYVVIAKIVATHGVKGALKVDSYLEDPKDLSRFKVIYDREGRISYRLRSCAHRRAHHFLVEFENVNDCNRAQELVGFLCCIPKDDLPKLTQESQFYVEDLVGLDVRSCTSNEVLGQVKAMQNFGAGDLFEIKLTNGRFVLVPYANDWPLEVDLESKIVTLGAKTFEAFVQESLDAS